MSDTIYALASGRPPSAIAVIRISGPKSRFVFETMTRGLAPERRAVWREIRDIGGRRIDDGLCLWFGAPRSFTGEDSAEFQVHGGRAVIAAMLQALSEIPGLRSAEPGEFTRRAFESGRLDLTEVEGLADLVRAETEQQRRQARGQAQGALRRKLEGWRSEMLAARAAVEADLDFSDEDDVPQDSGVRAWGIAERVGDEIDSFLNDGNRGEIVRDGLNAVLAGPPNAGKSSLLNCLAGRDIAIVAAEPGTTRDVLEAWLDIGGYAVCLVDTAGIRETANEIEAEGVRRARQRADHAHLVVWLSPAGQEPVEPSLGKLDCPIWTVRSKDDDGRYGAEGVSVVRPGGTDALVARIGVLVGQHAAGGEAAIVTRARHRQALENCRELLWRAARDEQAGSEVRAEWLRQAADWIGRLTGRIDVEEVLGAIFSEFCIGK